MMTIFTRTWYAEEVPDPRRGIVGVLWVLGHLAKCVDLALGETHSTVDMATGY